MDKKDERDQTDKIDQKDQSNWSGPTVHGQTNQSKLKHLQCSIFKCQHVKPDPVTYSGYSTNRQFQIPSDLGF